MDDPVTEIMTWFMSMLSWVYLGYVIEVNEVTSVNLTHRDRPCKWNYDMIYEQIYLMMCTNILSVDSVQ